MNPYRRVTHNIALVGTVFCIAGALTACGGDADKSGVSGASDNSEKSVELRATWWGGDALNQALQEAATRCSDTTAVSIKTEPQPWEGYWDKLATQAAGKNIPDVLMQAASMLPDYAGKGALLDLNTIEGLNLDVLDEGVRQFGDVGDETFAVVAATNAPGIIVNTEMVKEAGVTFPKGEYSWPDLAEFAKNVTTGLDDGKWALQDSSGDMILFILYVRDKTGGEFYNDDGTIAATPELLKEWLQWWQDLRDSGAVPPADVTAEAAGDFGNSPLVKGNAAMGFGWTQDFVNYQSLMPTELRIELPPYQDNNPSLWINAASLWSVSANAKNPQKATEFINCLISDPEAVEISGVSLGIPPSQAARDMLQGKLSDADQKAVDYMNTVAEISRPLNRLWPTGFSELRGDFANFNEAVAFGSTSPADATEGFFAKAKEFDSQQ